MIDSHIHLDQFSDEQITSILSDSRLDAVIAVATNLQSCQRLLSLKKSQSKIFIGAGFHPEQPLPSKSVQNELFDWIVKNSSELTVLGEIGLPHYRKQKQPNLDYTPYLELLEGFIIQSKHYDLPLNLHIVYDDTFLVLDLLAKHHIKRAHFHWFKGSDLALEALLATQYVVSITPDVQWNPKTQRVVSYFPLARLLIETDSPWQHQGFQSSTINQQLQAVIHKIAELKGISYRSCASQLRENILSFYRLPLTKTITK
ncbi:TatD DNase family protein [Nicoletella semolina]|uniref:TatD DNase family protein n=1 Tax=Nicoletella semolina TaxID=271160 RepID=A0A4R2N6P6_9PAST|nr:TatD family hydrolase [Nicoletella semolina]MDH2925168.1 deoxyribonuclease [Nicoletella semolina]TCP16521.1 TatD DNase family protein [Nicoletella semolina]